MRHTVSESPRGLAQLCQHYHDNGCPGFPWVGKPGTTDLDGFVHPSHTLPAFRDSASECRANFGATTALDISISLLPVATGACRCWRVRNPVKRGLVLDAEQWRWSSCRHYIYGERGIVLVNEERKAEMRVRESA